MNRQLNRGYNPRGKSERPCIHSAQVKANIKSFCQVRKCPHYLPWIQAQVKNSMIRDLVHVFIMNNNTKFDLHCIWTYQEKFCKFPVQLSDTTVNLKQGPVTKMVSMGEAQLVLPSCKVWHLSHLHLVSKTTARWWPDMASWMAQQWSLHYKEVYKKFMQV